VEVGRGDVLWLDFAPDRSGCSLIAREEARRWGSLLQPGLEGAAKQTLLHLRKHLDGRRLSELRRILGERTLLLEAGDVGLVLKFSGRGGLTLLREGEMLGSFGPGGPGLPAERPEREWRTLGAASPLLGADLAAWLADGPQGERLGRLEAPEPALVTPLPLAQCHDEDLVPPSSIALLPLRLSVPGRVTTPVATFREGARLFLGARLRAGAFARWKRDELSSRRKAAQKQATLLRHLEGDSATLPDPASLRRKGEALLASPVEVPRGAAEIRVPDPYAADGPPLSVPVNPRLSRAQNADRLFEKARRAEGAQKRIALRREGVARDLEALRADVERIEALRDLPETRGAPREPAAPRSGKPLVFLTSRGLVLRVGRGARENHALTFSVAKPEDYWLHARDVPGAHVVLEDREGRAGAEDLREAAETAAFMSEARAEARVDVHVTRRKHVRPAPGGAGRVRVSHSETLRVEPRDPRGRLRGRR
jgi:hypothetical protein